MAAKYCVSRVPGRFTKLSYFIINAVGQRAKSPPTLKLLIGSSFVHFLPSRDTSLGIERLAQDASYLIRYSVLLNFTALGALWMMRMYILCTPTCFLLRGQ